MAYAIDRSEYESLFVESGSSDHNTCIDECKRTSAEQILFASLLYTCANYYFVSLELVALCS
jgi:hypothetical protein